MKHTLRLSVAVALGVAAAALFGTAHPRAGYESERRIQMFNIHTNETIDIVYKKNGQYVPEALDKLNTFMRDWRAGKQTRMDPHTIDLVWEIHEELGSKVPIHLICGYRSSGTNEALRHAGGGQAKASQHILGKAMDVAFPDVPVQKLRYAGLVREAGGVGYYPTSGVPFVHIDTGNVRMWPGMPRYELALLFPKGHTKFLPADRRPITPSDVSYARGHYTQLADAISAFHQFRGQAKDRTLVASLETSQLVPADPTEVALEDGAADRAPVPVAVHAARQTVVAEADTTASTAAPVLAGPALKTSPARIVVKISKPVTANVVLASLSDVIPPRPALASRPAAARPASHGLAISATVSSRPGKASSAEFVPPEPTDDNTQTAFLNQTGWSAAPGYDEDHDNELSYRPFPIAGLLEADPSINNPVLAKLSKPNLTAAHKAIGEDDGLRMQFRPRLQVAEMLWNDDRAGRDPGSDLYAEAANEMGAGRIVRTTAAN